MLDTLCSHVRWSNARYIKAHFNVSSPLLYQSQADLCVSITKIYLRTRYFQAWLYDILSFFSGNKCITTGGNAPYKPCVFPFIYNGVKYNTCTYAGSQHTEGVAWCSTSTDRYDNHIQGTWGNCEQGSNCPLPSKPSNSGGYTKYGKKKRIDEII